MNYALLLGALLLGLVAHTHAKCAGSASNNKCTGDGIFLDTRKKCEEKGCCWKKNDCFTSSKPVTAPTPVLKDPATNSLFEETTVAATKRFLTFPGSQCIPPVVEFPWNCRPTATEPFVTESPVKVPYCVRIACSLDKFEQRALEYNHTLCILQPGCYFDAELAEIRTGYPTTLSGTPVCHFAIRSPIFHKYAEKVRLAFGRWNPYYTNCLLKKYDDEITEGPPGCKLIPLLEAFNIEPKLAGWGHIPPTSCSYIGGCWRQGLGCFYPVDINSVKVKSGQRFKYDPTEIQFGRPKCQHFDTSSAYTKLQSYHRCLRAGCTVDSYISSNYYYNLYELGTGFSIKDQYDYWSAVKGGYYGAHNVESISSKWKDETSSGGGRSAPSFNPSGLGSISSLFPGSTGGGASPVGAGVGQNGYVCGIRNGFIESRPCRPKKFPNPIYFYKCPYKDVYYPRFPTLKGSFKGCCDINLCYLARQDIRKMHSGPATYMLHWTAWSACSAPLGKCGVQGTQTRERECVDTIKKKCTSGAFVERKSCYVGCTGWGKWSSWPSCPRSCYPGGRITRRRICQPFGATCAADKDGLRGEEARECNTHSCSGRG